VNRELRLLCTSFFIWGLGEGLFFYFQPLYLEELGASPLQIGGILGMAGVGLVITHIPAGMLADKFGRRTIMFIASCLGTIAAWIMFVAPSLTFFVAGLVFYYFTGFIMSPLSSYVTAARGEWTVARALTTIFAFFGIGSILGPIIGGQLSGLIGLRSIYGVSASLFMVSTAVMVFLPPQPVEPFPLGTGYRRLRANKPFGRLLALLLFANFALIVNWPLLPNFLQNVRGVSVVSIGIFGSFNALGGVVLNLALGRMHNRPAFILAQGLIFGASLVLWLGTGSPWFALGYFLLGGFRAARAMMTALAETLVEKPQMGLAFGLVETASGLALLGAAPLAGLLYRTAPYLPFPVSMSLIVISLIISGRVLPRPKSASDSIEPRRKI